MIRLNNITKTYNQGKKTSTTPISGLSLEIKLGETVILSGPSGSGKSTLLNMIAGLIKPTSGSVEVNNMAVSKLPEHFAASYRRERIGMIFQQYNLIEQMSVADNIALPLIPSELSRSEITARIDALLKKLAIKDKENMFVEKLSGGEMQRTAIARALINQPDIILADEPTANLDSRLTAELLDVFRMMKDEEKTIIIATHDDSIINSGIADRVVKLSKGR